MSTPCATQWHIIVLYVILGRWDPLVCTHLIYSQNPYREIFINLLCSNRVRTASHASGYNSIRAALRTFSLRRNERYENIAFVLYKSNCEGTSFFQNATNQLASIKYSQLYICFIFCCIAVINRQCFIQSHSKSSFVYCWYSLSSSYRRLLMKITTIITLPTTESKAGKNII